MLDILNTIWKKMKENVFFLVKIITYFGLCFIMTVDYISYKLVTCMLTLVSIKYQATS